VGLRYFTHFSFIPCFVCMQSNKGLSELIVEQKELLSVSRPVRFRQ
jgi:hypothetical protein